MSRVTVDIVWEEDIGSGIIRIPKRVRDKIGVDLGDSVRIEGPNGSIVRIADYSWIEDVNQSIGRLDKKDRKEIGVEVGDTVILAAAEDSSDGEKYLLFSYGSNHTEQLSNRIGRNVEGTPAYLEGWKLLFAGVSRTWNGGGVAIIIQTDDRDDEVCGYVAEVTERELDKLDVHEGVAYDCYYQAYITAKVQTSSGGFRDRSVVAYLPGRRRQTLNAPSRRYVRAVKKTITEYWSGGGCLENLRRAIRDS